MIKLLNESKLGEYILFCENYVDGINILTGLYTYGLNSEKQTFYYGENENGINLALCRSGNVLTLCGKVCDNNELKEFAFFTGAEIITSEKNTFDCTDFKNIRTSYIMVYSGSKTDDVCTRLDGENIKELYSVIYENGNDGFDEWYTDISHKIRHCLIRAYGLKNGDKFISSAVTSGETENSAVISAVSVKERYRHNGAGRITVMSLVNSLLNDNKKIYLFTDNETTVKWYISMGFIIKGSHITATVI